MIKYIVRATGAHLREAQKWYKASRSKSVSKKSPRKGRLKT